MKMITFKEFTIIWLVIMFSALVNSAKASDVTLGFDDSRIGVGDLVTLYVKR